MPRAYAEDTTVPVQKTQQEIAELLRAWRCDGIRWTEMYAAGRSTLEFLWTFEGRAYLARFTVTNPSDDLLKKRAKTARGLVSEAKLKRLRALAGRHEHRTLLYFIRSAFAAVQARLVTAEQVFLPFLVGADGRTVAEAALPRIHELLEGRTGAELLALPPPPG